MPCAKTKSKLKLDGFGFKYDIVYDEDTLSKVFHSMDPMFEVVKEAAKKAKTFSKTATLKESIYDISILQDIEKVINDNWQQIYDKLEDHTQDELRDSLFVL